MSGAPTPPRPPAMHLIPDLEPHSRAADCLCGPIYDEAENLYRHRTFGERIGLGRWTILGLLGLLVVALFLFIIIAPAALRIWEAFR